jgi:hypothetical protein
MRDVLCPLQRQTQLGGPGVTVTVTTESHYTIPETGEARKNHSCIFCPRIYP